MHCEVLFLNKLPVKDRGSWEDGLLIGSFNQLILLGTHSCLQERRRFDRGNKAVLTFSISCLNLDHRGLQTNTQLNNGVNFNWHVVFAKS